MFLTEYHLPDGRRSTRQVSTSEAVAVKVAALRNEGYRFEMEVLNTGVTYLTVIDALDEDHEPVVSLLEKIEDSEHMESACESLVERAWAARPQSSGRTITIAKYRSMSRNMTGLCMRCSKLQHNTEPDARRYPCDKCHKRTVYGPDSLLEIGMVR